MNGNINRAEIKRKLVNGFSEIGEILGLNSIDIREDKNSTSMYLVGTNALELEIDWHENVLYMYIVHLIDGKIPSDDIIYKYDDGAWCRIYIDEVYSKKNPICKLINRTRPNFLLELFQYYKKLIESDPSRLLPYFDVNLNT